ncbi:hypothetical protein MMC13_006120 [Lambiella insularis]|nr:hypothetical protein [Lambiella insularis]
MAYYAGMTETTLQAAGQARMNRILTEKARDPAFAYNPANQIVSNAETSLYLGVLGDINTGIAPVNYVQIFFEQERLPYTEGWRPSSTPIGLLNLNVLIAKVASASGETAVDLETMTATTLKNALSNIF